MIETTLSGMTPDLAEENILKLRELFPDVFTEDKIDFDKLQQVLGSYVDNSSERYNFTWNGKSKALRLAQTPSLGTLRPCKEESKDWDTTQNLYIEGDNLEVLKLLQKSYHGKVKMIYIDPPYNTGKDFVYPDDFKDNIENYRKITGQVDGDGKALSTNNENNGRYHTDWLNMMYPRLRLARNLLKDDGAIFISIDDHEVDSMKKLCDEIFGEDNFISRLVWQQRKGGGNDSRFVAVDHEYILVYAKHYTSITKKWRIKQSDEYLKRYKEVDDNGDRYYWDTLSRNGLQNPIVINLTAPDGKIITVNSQKSEKNVLEGLRNETIKFTKRSEDWSLHHRVYMPEGQVLRSLLVDYGNNRSAGLELVNLFGDVYFDYAKPTTLIEVLMQLNSESDSDSDSIVLDFFSGSATTAHATMKLNAEDKSVRKFIMVQLPELIDENNAAHKAGFDTICEIGKERIRRAGEHIKATVGFEAQNLDIGFKVLKLDNSNIRKWQPDYENFEMNLENYIDNYVEDRTELDIVYEIMLKYGLDLTYPVDELSIDGKNIYSVGFGMLMICLEDEVTIDVAHGIVRLINELKPESTRVVFKDNGFKTDSNKTNIKEILKCGGVEEFITI